MKQGSQFCYECGRGWFVAHRLSLGLDISLATALAAFSFVAYLWLRL